MNILLILTVVILVGAAAVCSGLNVALMSLDIEDIRRKARLGNLDAIRVLPIRSNSHLALTSILLTNVGVISATSLVMNHYYNGIIAGIVSTLLIVIFGEIIPQALFVKHALHMSAKFIWVLRVMIIVTYPVAKPLQLILDRIIGPNKTLPMSRGELGIIINDQRGHRSSDLDEDEIDIIKGALQLSNKRLRDIMTPIERVYWLTEDTLIDEKRIDEIKQNGWSRIPIFDSGLTNCRGVLLMKDLFDIDFDEQPVLVNELPLRQTKMVGSMTALDTLFRYFIGMSSHLIPVERDDHIIGIVTIEDLIEEIIGHEIEDETDLARMR